MSSRKHRVFIETAKHQIEATLQLAEGQRLSDYLNMGGEFTQFIPLSNVLLRHLNSDGEILQQREIPFMSVNRVQVHVLYDMEVDQNNTGSTPLPEIPEEVEADPPTEELGIVPPAVSDQTEA